MPTLRPHHRRLPGTSMDRIVILAILFGVVTFLILFGKLFQLQVIQHDDLNKKALTQQTREVTSTADRGTIYDAKGEVLAISGPVKNVILSPRDVLANIKVAKKDDFGNPRSEAVIEAERAQKIQETYDLIADGMERILGLDREDVLARLQKTESAWQVLAKKVEDDVADEIRAFVKENELGNALYLTSDSKRYYPYSSLAAQTIGFVNSSNSGAYGLESLYDDQLSGEDGRTVTAKNASGTEMLFPYTNYTDPIDGCNVNTTIDATIQMYAERTLEEGIEKFDVINGGFCIVMDPDTAAVKAIASYPDFDLNDPNAVTDQRTLNELQKMKDDPNVTEEEYQAAYGEAQFQQWSNRALNTAYEPGSTFKPVVLAAALEEGAVSESDTFYCSGVVHMDQWDIRCSKRSGHGTQTLRQAVMNSCNPAFIAIGQKLGAERFYQYWEDFGFTATTGIELPGEQQSNFWDKEEFISPSGIVSLATASFGQRFLVTPIQLITAQCATINGGHLMQPYIVQSVTDADGNVVSYHEPTEVRQVISQETSDTVRSILESVVGDRGGTGKNAYVEGYRIGGKTGSSQTTTTNVDGHVIVSFLGFAPADDPEVVVLLAYDSPKPATPDANTTADGIYISGGTMAAPMAGQLIADILDYMGYQKAGTSTGTAGTTIPRVVGETVENAQATLSALGLKSKTSGTGSLVIDQTPSSGSSVPNGSTVVLYLGDESQQGEMTTMPDLSDLTYTQAKAAMDGAGLYLKATGVGESGSVFSQSVEPGTPLEVGTVVEVRFTDPTASND